MMRNASRFSSLGWRILDTTPTIDLSEWQLESAALASSTGMGLGRNVRGGNPGMTIMRVVLANHQREKEGSLREEIRLIRAHVIE
jgi:hypothetical protein